MSGLPEKSSPSTQTVPASMASCSVDEMTGRNCIRSIRPITAPESARRTGGIEEDEAQDGEDAREPQRRAEADEGDEPEQGPRHSGAPVKPSTNRTRRTPSAAAHGRREGVEARRGRNRVRASGRREGGLTV